MATATIENILDNNIKLEDIKPEYKWVLYKYSSKSRNLDEPYCIQFTEQSFMDSYNKISLLPMDEAGKILRPIFSGPNEIKNKYRYVMDGLRNAFSKWLDENKQTRDKFDGTFMWGASIEDIKEKLAKNNITSIDVGSMDVIEAELK